MSRTRTIDDLIFDVRRRTNMEFSELIDDDEILEYLNQELAELAQHLRRNEAQPHSRTTSTIAVVAGTSLYTLPPDFWEILGVSASIGGLPRPLDPFLERERPGLTSSILTGTLSGPMYRLASRTQIEFLPAKLSFTATLSYVSAQTRLLRAQIPAQTVDGYNGYEMAAVYGACASVREKEDADTNFFESRKTRFYALIEASAGQRDASAPERVTDVTGGLDYDMFSPYGFR